MHDLVRSAARGVIYDPVRSAGTGVAGLLSAVLLVPAVGRLLAVADRPLGGLSAAVLLVLVGAGCSIGRRLRRHTPCGSPLGRYLCPGVPGPC